MNYPSLQDLLGAGAHFGHTEGRWHPKAASYIHGARSGIHIINLEQTLTRLQEVMPLITQHVAAGKTIMFVGTKRQAAPLVKKYAESCGMPYVTTRWLGGMITNFDCMRVMLDHYRKMLSDKEQNVWEKFTKKERVVLEKELEKKNEVLGGLRAIRRMPDMLFIVDVRHEKTALTEARSKNVPVIAMADTNINPEHITHAIPGNDDAVKSIELFCSVVAQAVNEGMAQRAQVTEKTEPVEKKGTPRAPKATKEVVAASV